MKRICEFCGKEYNWEEGQLNWTKDGIGNGPGTNNSKRFCSYKCGILYKDKKRKCTCLEKYGVNNINLLPEIRNKIKKTNLEKYGNPNGITFSKINYELRKQRELETKRKNGTLLSERIKDPIEFEKMYGQKAKDKIKQTRIKKHNTWSELYQNKEWKAKRDIKEYNTKKKNNSFNSSRQEDQIYQLLLQKFDKVERQYKSEKYPFLCDLYIPSIDLYIEYQGFWHHGNEPYNENNEKHKKIIEKWKSKKSGFYNIGIHVWTISDPLKRQIAKENDLNWIEFFNMEEFYQWYNNQTPCLI